MQFKAIVSALALATLAAATGSCSTSDLQCCNSTGKAGDADISKILGPLGIVVQDVNALVGVDCTPITVIGAGSDSCSAQTVCCTDNSFKGVVALGCSPISL